MFMGNLLYLLLKIFKKFTDAKKNIWPYVNSIVHHERAPIFSTSSSVPTTDESQTSDHALTASPIPQHGLATSPVSSEINHDAESQSMLSDASIPDNSSKRYPSPNTDSESLRTGIETFIQDSQPPKDNHLRVAIHGGKPSLSTVLFVQKKVKAKDAWTRSFILKAASTVDHPPDFELPHGSGPLCPNDLFVCVDLSLWHKGEDVLSANTISSSTTSSSAPSSSIASSRNDSLHWSDPSMSQYLRIWCWNFDLKVWQPIDYGCSRCITSYDLVLGFYRNTFEPLWVTPDSLHKKNNRRLGSLTKPKIRRKSGRVIGGISKDRQP
ncbi:hypothetical protein C8J55DRAFT_484728 [Lentinula edodes]|uniref:Uncharacterized protein n=1 Tax=Lentinula lateritia TaxID=40482 RepID=A0A9W9B0K2_9AGAR|nr:hypothetical protein C8J55DRAFT_484728 [Lentinula edodes]